MFSKVWPTPETFKYFQYLTEVSYGEKLMGEKKKFVNDFVRFLLSNISDAFEYFYGEHRTEGMYLYLALPLMQTKMICKYFQAMT